MAVTETRGAAKATWDPAQYARFADQRARPGRELMTRIPLAPDMVRSVVDLGCGTGSLTSELKTRYPNAHILGIDNNAAMLDTARAHAGIEWRLGDIEAWEPDAPVDVIYANASLMWLGDHSALFPRLICALAPGGALAVQMRDNAEEPSHRLMRDIGADGPWAAAIAANAKPVAPILTAPDYYDLLACDGAMVDIWRTVYWQVLTGPDPVFEWVKGTGLRPYLDALDGALLDAFTGAYKAAVRGAYPMRPDGVTLYPFPRLSMVAVKAR